jgi:hypothetical protein
MIKSIIKTLLTFLVILLVISLLGSVLILLSFGLGWLLRIFLPFSPFEATLLALLVYLAFGAIALKILWPTQPPYSLPEDGTEEWDEDDEDDEDLEKEPVVVYYPKNMRKSFFNKSSKEVPEVAPDARCPCGSGRKYKNCHGRAKAAKIDS